MGHSIQGHESQINRLIEMFTDQPTLRNTIFPKSQSWVLHLLFIEGFTEQLWGLGSIHFFL